MKSYVLIAEPNHDRASSLAAMCRLDGFSPVIALNGAFAVTTLERRGVPELLLTELSLPLIDGFELIERLRREVQGKETAIIVVSASRELRDKASGLRIALGVDAILAPVASNDSMRRIIKHLLEHRRAARPAVAPEAHGQARRDGAPESEAATTARNTGIRLRETNILMSSLLARKKRSEHARA